jgi:ParB/RepB/Spo0J family partition protein
MLVTLPTDKIYFDKAFNCRGAFTPQSCIELSENIKQHGLMFPVVVQPSSDTLTPPGYEYRLIAGHRRFIAVTLLLQQNKIEAIVRSGLTEEQAKLINLVENLERKDLSFLEEIKSLKALFPPDTTPYYISKVLKKSKNWCYVRWNYDKLPDHIKNDVEKGILTASDLQYIYCARAAERLELAEQLKQARLNGQATSAIMRNRGKRAKTRKDIHRMLCKLMDEGIEPLAYNALLWAAGDLPDEELYA